MSNSSTVSFLFPGQGAHCADMLDGLSGCSAYGPRLELVADLLHVDPLTRRHDLNFINSNKVSSLLTVLASSLSLDLVRQTGLEARCIAGYSVGQWTALYAANCISFEKLIEIVATRADFMDDCFRERRGGMLAVIGLPLDSVQQICDQIQSKGLFLTVSNFNCVGQYSLAGDLEALELAEASFEKLPVKKIQRLPVAGAWHCEILNSASEKFFDYLTKIELAPPLVPVCDNVTGEFVPEEPLAMRRALARQISCPVQWEKCIQTMCKAGCTELVEIGFGNILTKFGFFISRKVAHKAFYAGGAGG